MISPALSNLPFSQRIALSSSSAAENSSTLSIIAASASHLEALMPGSGYEDQDGLNERISNSELTYHTPKMYNNSLNSMAPPRQGYATSDRKTSRKETMKAPLLPQLMNTTNKYNARIPAPIMSHGRAQKSRGRLSSSRRQEVQSIRKKGACIRCRMLRKTVRLVTQGGFRCLLILTVVSVVEIVLARPVLPSSLQEYGSSIAYERAL